MKRFILNILAVVFIITGQLAFALKVDSVDGKDVYELKVADWFPTSNPISVAGAQYWMDQVEKLTDGAVKFKYYPSSQLAASRDLLAITQSGLTDIAATAPEFHSDKMPLATVADLPGLFDESCVGTEILWEMSTEGGILYDNSFLPQKIHPLILAVTPQYELLSSKKITTPEDAKGLNIRSAGATKDLTINSLESTPVNIAPAEMYQALKLGTVDAVAFPYSNATAYSLEEVAKYGTVGASLGSFFDLYAISDASWQKLPEDIQEAMLEAGKATSRHLCKVLNDETEEKISIFEENGVEITRADEETKSLWVSATEDVIDAWIERYEKRGLDATSVIEELNRLKEKYSNQ